jgi:Mitochondrial carrier protein
VCVLPHLQPFTTLQAGGLAGTSVDLLFYPIDSIKTRLQSDHGFYKAGGFRGIYNGVGSVIVGSAPGGMFMGVLIATPVPNSRCICLSRGIFLHLRRPQARTTDPSPPRARQPHVIRINS